MMKELKSLIKTKRIKKNYKANTLKCLSLQSKLESALKELEKLKTMKNVRDSESDSDKKKYKD